MVGQTFSSITCHFIFLCHACITYIAIHQVKYLMPNLFSRLRNIGDQWKARISAIENIQEEFGYDIREIKEQLDKLKTLFEDHIKTETVHP